jgi:hypothetical protein
LPIRGRADTLENEKNTNCSIRTPSMHRPAHIILECIGSLQVLQRAEVCDGYDELGAQCRMHTSSVRERVLGSPPIAMNHCKNHARGLSDAMSTACGTLTFVSALLRRKGHRLGMEDTGRPCRTRLVQGYQNRTPTSQVLKDLNFS